MTDTETTKRGKGRPKKALNGKTLFIPSHLVACVMALLETDKQQQPKKYQQAKQ